MQKQAAARDSGAAFDLSQIVDNRHFYELATPYISSYRLWQRGISYEMQGYGAGELPAHVILNHLFLEELANAYGAKRSPKNNSRR